MKYANQIIYIKKRIKQIQWVWYTWREKLTTWHCTCGFQEINYAPHIHIKPKFLLGRNDASAQHTKWPHKVLYKLWTILSKSSYNALFIGVASFEPWEPVWKTLAPKRCQFVLWLIAHNRCWTADRLVHQGLPHPNHCPLCEKEPETILSGCTLSRPIAPGRCGHSYSIIMVCQIFTYPCRQGVLYWLVVEDCCLGDQGHKRRYQHLANLGGMDFVEAPQ